MPQKLINNEAPSKVIKSMMDINVIFSFFNAVVFTLILYVLFFDAGIDVNPYIDRLSMLLGLLLCIQTKVLLYIEKRNKDPFVLVLVYVTIFYYSLRLFTIALYPYSIVFARGLYSPTDSNIALVIIIVSNACLAAGLFSKKQKLNVNINSFGCKPTQPIFASFALFFLVIFSVSFEPFPIEGFTNLFNLILLFFSPVYFLIIFAVYVIAYRSYVKLPYKIALIIFVFVLIALQTIGGSRSGILTYITYSFFVIIALIPYFKIRRSVFVSILIFSPVLLLTASFLFVSVTMSRPKLHDTTVHQSVSERYNLINENLKSDYSGLDEAAIGLIFARIGYFDFTSEIIAHKELYSKLFTPSSYFKSIVDNVLTPGFDVFDYPKIANGMSQIYNGSESLSKKEVMVAYQSDQISLIAEMFMLFGYASFFILFLIGRYFKVMYVGLIHQSPFNSALKKVFLIVIFYLWILSFGLDWLILDIIIMTVSVMFMKRLFFFINTNITPSLCSPKEMNP